MNPNDLVTITLLFVAISDSVMAQFVLPTLLAKNPQAAPEKTARVIRFIHASSLFMFLIAMFFYGMRPL